MAKEDCFFCWGGDRLVPDAEKEINKCVKQKEFKNKQYKGRNCCDLCAKAICLKVVEQNMHNISMTLGGKPWNWC